MKSIFIPTKRMQYILTAILLLVLVISLLNFPLTRMFTGDIENDLSLQVGWPMVFFELSLSNPENFPIPLYGLPIIVDMAIYVFIAYLIEIFILFMIDLLGRRIPKEVEKEEAESVAKERTSKNNNPDVYEKAKEAYKYYKEQGMSDLNIKELFRQKGWSEENIKKIL